MLYQRRRQTPVSIRYLVAGWQVVRRPGKPASTTQPTDHPARFPPASPIRPPHGGGGPASVASVQQWLKEIFLARPVPQLMDLAMSFAEFLLRDLLPISLCQAAFALSSKNELPKLGMLQGLLVIIGWLEQHCTRIVDKSGAEHRRAATIAGFFGGSPSVRKSILRGFISHTFLDVLGTPQEIA